MSTVAKFGSIALLGSGLLGASLAPAHAFRMPDSATGLATTQKTVSAYAGDGQTQAAPQASILSSDEIRHIQWCAARYTLTYDAVNDTYAGVRGKSIACHSPH